MYRPVSSVRRQREWQWDPSVCSLCICFVLVLCIFLLASSLLRQWPFLFVPTNILLFCEIPLAIAKVYSHYLRAITLFHCTSLASIILHRFISS